MIEGWLKTTLREVTKCKGGTSFPPALQGQRSGDVPFYKVSDMNTPGNNRFMDVANNYVSNNNLSKLKAQPHAALSVVFPKVGGALLTNKKRMLAKPSLVDNNMMVVTPLDQDICNPYFLLMLFESINLRDLSNPGPLPSINAARVYEHALLLPPLPEQKKIAAVLLKIQRAIETQDKIINSLRDLKKSTMQHLFTHGLRGEKTKRTKIGEIPESWDESTLGELCHAEGGRIQTGPFGSQLHASDYQGSGIPVVNPTHMLENKIIHKGIPRVSVANADRLSRHILRAGDILFARRGEIGRHALVTEDEAGWLCGTGCFLVRVRDPRVLDSFISWGLYAQQSQDWLIAHATGAIMPNLNNKILQVSPVVYPNVLEEQKQIVEALDELEQKIEHHQSKQAALKDLFKTTLNKLMTGDIRVADLDIDVKEVEA